MKKGFTLIELLVVIAIIALLASVVISSLQSARQRARDAQRYSDIQQIHNAIELYILDNGHAPYLVGDACTPGNGDSMCFANSDSPAEYGYDPVWQALETQLSPYIDRLPNDPCGSACYTTGNKFYNYTYASPGVVDEGESSYQIFAKSLETKTGAYGYTTMSLRPFASQ